VYPRAAARIRDAFDLFHVADHTYAHLVHVLPPDRTGVYCHDLDAFRCVLDPSSEPRPRWFRAMAASALDGLRRAAVVFHNSAAVRRLILEHALVPPDRLVHAPFGAAAEFAAGEPAPDDAAGRTEGPYLLHVGSCVPRKRVDVLVEAFAGARAVVSGLRLVQVGGTWPPSIRARLRDLGVARAVRQERDVPRARLAELYRGSALVVQPSEAEGFGLPVLEALACGARVLASDIPALREVGGAAATYCTPGDVRAFTEAVVRLLSRPDEGPPRAVRLAQASRFSRDRHVEAIARSYAALGACPAARGRSA
jgi:glycosyltransferase involved in cell wall biosynthesis